MGSGGGSPWNPEPSRRFHPVALHGTSLTHLLKETKIKEVGVDWATPADLKRDIGTASILKDGRAVFNLAGNKYRLVVWINYAYRVVYVRFIGTHAQYDKIDAQTI
jgi:mRNA-degrading endonuclease HigB of HigAB toxin-antitoxin module